MLVKQRNGAEEQQAKKVCTSFYPEISKMPVNETSVEYHPVLDAFDWWPCSRTPPPGRIFGHFLLLDGRLDLSNCSLLEAASAVQALGAAGSIFVRSKQPPTQTTHNTSLWFSFIGNSTYNLIISDNTTKVAVYSPREDFSLNYSLIIIWLLAVGTVTVGAYWSGRLRHSQYKEDSHVSVPRRRRRSSDGTESAAGDEHVKQEEFFVNARFMIFLVVMMCLMLVALYYLYQYLVYVIIGLFCIASVFAVYSCLEPLVLCMPCATCRTPYFNVYVLRGQVEVRQALLLLFALGLVITWLVLRNEPYAWVLLDVLGVAFCINMLRQIKLPDLRICTVLLSCLFFYDIFFVFITPLFTSDGNSIMVEVAKGGGGEGGEQLPMVFKVPHFVYTEVVSVCQLSGNYNLLGFGDVIVPGLLVAFLYSYDLRTRGPKFPLYFTINVIAYGVGLCLTFLGLYVMQGAQPALLYLVPCTLLTTVVIAAVRGDLALMWRNTAPNDESLTKIEDNEEDEAAHGAHDGLARSATSPEADVP